MSTNDDDIVATLPFASGMLREPLAEIDATIRVGEPGEYQVKFMIWEDGRHDSFVVKKRVKPFLACLPFGAS